MADKELAMTRERKTVVFQFDSTTTFDAENKTISVNVVEMDTSPLRRALKRMNVDETDTKLMEITFDEIARNRLLVNLTN